MSMLGRSGPARVLQSLLVVATLGTGLVVETLVASPAGAQPPCSPTGPTGINTSPPPGATCDITGTATLTGGTLTIEAPSTLSWADTLTGMDTAVSAAATLTAVDSTGSGAGWNITAAATQFTDGSGDMLPTGSLSLNGAADTESDSMAPVDTKEGSSTAATGNEPTYPATGIDGDAPIVLYLADQGSGMGANDLATYWWLSIPGNTKAGTYASTITLQIASGPSS